MMTIRQFQYDVFLGIITSTYVGVDPCVGVGHSVRDYLLGKFLSLWFAVLVVTITRTI